MTDENDKTAKPESSGEGAAKADAVIDKPAPSGPQISPAQADVLAKKVESAGAQVEVAQQATHEEHIDHVLTRGKPVTPAHEVELAAGSLAPPSRGSLSDHVRLVYGPGLALASSEPRKGSRMKPVRLLAQYDTTADVIHAAETFRDAGYSAFETHSPFPVHGMDAAMGLRDSRLGWIVLACGLTGVSCAWLMMFWMNGIDYPLIIGGKPPGTLPSMVPIMFEVTVLLSSFGAVFGMLGLNRLPQHHDPLFYSERFASFSNDKFFLSVEAQDPKFNVERTRVLLEKTKPVAIESIEDVAEVES
jgi:hypothetical protein